MATLTWLLDVNAPNAAKTFDEIKKRMVTLDADLKKTREISVGDRNAMATFAKLQLQADRFKDKLHGMDLTIDGAGRAEAQLLGLEATADRLKGKLGDVGKVGILSRIGGPFAGGGDRGFFSRLLLGGQGKGPGGEAAGSGLLGLLGTGLTAGGATPYLYGGGALLAALLAPAALPLGLAGLTGGGAALGAFAIGKAALKQEQALNKQLASATKAAQRRQIREQLAALQQSSGPELSIASAFSDLGIRAKTTFAGALKARGPADIGMAGFLRSGQGAGTTPSFLQGLAGILKQIGGFIKSIGPQLGDLFRASIPYLRTFVGFMEEAAKTLLPVFVQMLQEMRPDLPLIAKGLANIVSGFAGFLKAIGPSGMEASAKIFVVLTKAMAAVLVGLGHTINWLTENVPTWVHDVAKWWDWLRHHTANVFDGIRHDIADALHWIANEFDTWRHTWAHIWDTIYSGTIGNVIRIDRGILTWFGKIPGQIRNVFRGALTWLYNSGKDVLQGLWNGLLFIWHKVTGFISGIASWIKAHKGPVHLDAHLLEPAGRALMSGLLKGLVGGFGAVASFIGGVAGKIAGSLGLGGVTPSALQKAALSMFPAFGWPAGQLPYLIALWNQESGWNPRAMNPTSGAYGIPQALPASKMASAGADWRTNPITQIRWGLGYIRSVYGTPAGAWAHERAFNWYGSGLSGGIFNRPTLIGVGERGPERVDVTPVGSRRGGAAVALTQNGDVNIYDATNVDLVRQRLSFAMVAAGLS